MAPPAHAGDAPEQCPAADFLFLCSHLAAAPELAAVAGIECARLCPNGLYGSADDPIGVTWLMLWKGRSLAILDNIVRRTRRGDRVLVVYGAGHGNLLRQRAVDSGDVTVQDTPRWLRGAAAR